MKKMPCALWLWTLLLTAAPLDVRSEVQPGPGEMPTEPLAKRVMTRGIEELAISQSANMQSMEMSKTASVHQQDLVANMAVEAGEKSYAKVTSLTSKARAQALEARMWAARAQIYADHAKKVLDESRFIAQHAAENAVEAVKGWIADDAAETAERSAMSDAEIAKSKVDKLAGAVAAAVEPYHLAALRNQKFCAETYAKAKTAQSSSLKLVDDAKALALKAQEMQAQGLGVEAQESMSMAHGMVSQSQEMGQWALKMYNQANTACGGGAGYNMEAEQAAANAAATAIINTPMKLPAARKKDDDFGQLSPYDVELPKGAPRLPLDWPDPRAWPGMPPDCYPQGVDPQVWPDYSGSKPEGWADWKWKRYLWNWKIYQTTFLPYRSSYVGYTTSRRRRFKGMKKILQGGR